jgi:hypothetical protein
MAPAAVRVRQSTHVTVSQCTFRQLGSWGLAVTHGSQHVTVSNNLFTDSAAGGLYVGNVNETRSDLLLPKPEFINVADNVVDTVGTEFQGTSGLHLFSAISTILQHNRILNNP